MDIFKIEGGHRLKGSITPQGAKNEALQIICATLLTPEPVKVTNIPDIRDVNFLIELLGKMNVHIERPSRDTCGPMMSIWITFIRRNSKSRR